MKREWPVDAALLAWARERLHPLAEVGPDTPLSALEPLRAMIGDARIVSFGEGLHGGAEPMGFRNLLFRFLVERMGFTAIAIESGMPECRGVNDYVRGGGGDSRDVIARGIWPGLAELPQQASLVQWMRAYNADPRHARKLQFFGFTLPGPDNHALPLEDALRYLDGVDPPAADALRERTRALVSNLRHDRFDEGAPDQYAQLPMPLRDRMTAAIADLNTLFRLHEHAYVAASSAQAYALACRSAVLAAQVDASLRQVPFGWSPKAGPLAALGTSAVNDRASADNVRWILEQLPPGARILLFAHRFHVATAPSLIRLAPDQDAVLLPPPMGTYLKRWFADDVVTIGNLVGAEDVGSAANQRVADESSTARVAVAAGIESLEGQLSTLGVPFFLLDQRSAPGDVASALQMPREVFGPGFPNTLSVGNAFDIIFFSRRVTPAIRRERMR